MRALVTGGFGFIGSNLARQLVLDGYDVLVVDDMSAGHEKLLDDITDRDNWEFIKSDFASHHVLNWIKTGVFDVVFHLAATPRVSYSVEHPAETNDNNVSKTVRLLEACTQAYPMPVVVFSSSSSVYGGADHMPTPETHSTSPKSPYALQKRIIEDYLKLFYDLYGLQSVALRYFNVFGPSQYGDSPYSTAVSAWCHAVKQGLPCRLDGDGTQSRDMTFVDNVVQANIAAALTMIDAKIHQSAIEFNGRTYNVGCGERITNNEILEMFKDRIPGVSIVNAPARVGDVKHTRADYSKAHRELGYVPNVKFVEGLERTWQWWGL